MCNQVCSETVSVSLCYLVVICWEKEAFQFQLTELLAVSHLATNNYSQLSENKPQVNRRFTKSHIIDIQRRHIYLSLEAFHSVRKLDSHRSNVVRG